ncbi:hypothetical protein ACM6L3_16300 [Paenibacillus larvae]
MEPSFLHNYTDSTTFSRGHSFMSSIAFFGIYLPFPPSLLHSTGQLVVCPGQTTVPSPVP